MSVDEYADYERRVNGELVWRVGRVWWRRVRPFFYRPLFLHEAVPGPESVPAWASALGGAQYPVQDGEPSNSNLTLLVHDRLSSYCLEDLPCKSRRCVAQAAKALTMAAIPDAETFARLAHPVYLDFLSRSRYDFNSRRRDSHQFRAWAQTLYSFPKIRVLGAFCGLELAAVLICFQVRHVVYYNAQFGNRLALKHHANDLLLHTVKMCAGGSPGVEFLYADTAGMPRGLDWFYLRRGFHKQRRPALLQGNPVTLATLRLFFPITYRKLVGLPEEARRVEGSPAARSSADDAPDAIRSPSGGAGASSPVPATDRLP